MAASINVTVPAVASLPPTAPVVAKAPEAAPPTDSAVLSRGIGADDVVYFPLTDRFYRGNKDSKVDVNPNDPLSFHGGDLQGLAQKADYVKSLGATVLWLAPFMQNTQKFDSGDYHAQGYHGYWITNHEKVEAHQGTEADLENTVKTYHDKGIKVVADIVLNQVGFDHPWTSDPTKKDWFHHEGGIQNYDDQHQVENGDLGGLPDLNQDNPEVYKYLLKNTADWVKKLDLDGVRLDAVKHVSKRFWKTFVPDLKQAVGKPDLFVLGEVFKGDPTYLADYQKVGLDHVFDIPLRDTMVDVFGNDHSMKELGARLAQDKEYEDPNKMVTLMDNHDLPRFISASQGDFDARLQRTELATAFLDTVRGIPSFYYGDENALEGGSDPDNRRDMDFDRKPEVRAYFTKLLDIRAHNDSLRHGKQLELLDDDQVYAFARRTDKEEAICVFNNAPDSEKRQIPLHEGSSLADGTVLVDQISGREFAVKDGRVDVDMPGRSPLILTKKA